MLRRLRQHEDSENTTLNILVDKACLSSRKPHKNGQCTAESLKRSARALMRHQAQGFIQRGHVANLTHHYKNNVWYKHEPND